MFCLGAALTSAESNLLQEILEESEVPVRLRKTLELLKKEYAMCMLQQKIGKEVPKNCVILPWVVRRYAKL